MKHFYLLIFLLTAGICFSQDPYSNASLVHTAIREEGRVVGQMDNSVPTDLPVGMSRMVGGQEYLVGIDSIVLSPDGSYMSATSMVEVPATGDLVAFSGTKISITPNGVKGASAARLNLAADVPIRLSDKLKLTLKGTERKTYLEFDCNGFTGLGIQGEFEFCRSFLVPELPNGELAPEPARVKAAFETQMSDWGDIVAKVSITPFQVPNLKGFGFYVQDAYVDQSDVNNPLSLIFPKDYNSPELQAGSPNLWKGFFLKQLSVRLPSGFSEGKPRKEIQANNVLIDNMGFSGSIAGKGIIPFEEGNMSGWPFSVDEIAVGITCNKLTGAGFKGNINLPVAKEDTKLAYTAVIQSGDNYMLSVQSQDELEVPLWKAKMHLYPTTVYEIAYTGGKFRPRAVLNGDISLTPDLGTGGDQGEFHGIIFENLVVQSGKPHIVPGVFTIESRENKVAGFSFTLKDIGIVQQDSSKVGLRMGMAIHLMNDDDGGFSGETNLTVFGNMEETSGRQKWKYDHLELNRVRIDVNQEVYKIHGELTIYRKDKEMGSGFLGKVDAEFKGGLKVAANAQFGNVNDLRYWYVDALVKLPAGTPIGPGFALYGFGGGLYHHMRRSDVNNVPLQQAPVATASDLAQPVAQQVAEIQPPPSGVRYVPDANTFLGLKATVIAGTSSPKAFNADATFEIAFNNNRGVNYIGLYGAGYFMTDINKRDENVPVKADVNITMDFVNEVLHGNFDVYVNVANGMLHGINPNNLAGSAVLHFDKKDWYIYVGTPDTRLGVSFAGLFKATAYFMVGTQIPGMPAQPQNVSDILGGMDLNFMRDENALGNGKGFCFGASLDVNTGKKTFLIFYGQFGAGAGFDIMLKDYGPDVQCAGRGNLGMNGWYASGQAYAYLQGEIGIHVDLKFVQGEFKIIELGAAAVLQAKLPNPTFLRGVVGGYYAILGGKIKGHCRFELTIGEECQMVNGGSVVSGLDVISEVSPKEGEQAVNVFNNPQAAFNMPLEKPFELEDLDGQVKAFRVRLGSFKLMKGSAEIPGTLTWNEAMDVVAFSPSDILPGKTSVKATVKVYFEERKNGTWNPVVVNGKTVEETKEASFQTGEAPDVIPVSNVKYSYPEINQYHFLVQEYGSGYIQLKKGQDELFEEDAAWKKVIRFTSEGQTGIETAVRYNTTENTVTYDIPQTLQKGKVYVLSLVNVPAGSNATVDANVKEVEKSDETGAFTQVSKSIEGSLTKLEEKVIYQSAFRTSQYATFAEKVKSLNVSQAWSFPIFGYNGLSEVGVSISGNETFDKFEIAGTEGAGRLISIQGNKDNSWYNKRVYPLIYKNYPVNGTMSITWRTGTELGVPPLKAVEIRQTPDDKVLSEGEAASGSATGVSGYAQAVYNLPFYMYKDYLDLQQKCAAYLINHTNAPQEVWDLVYKPFPNITSGRYDIELQYTLPGINKITSTYKIILDNP